MLLHKERKQARVTPCSRNGAFGASDVTMFRLESVLIPQNGIPKANLTVLFAFLSRNFSFINKYQAAHFFPLLILPR